MISVKEYIKIVSTVPESFIDELFELYDITTLQTDFVVKLDVISKWLKCNKGTLVKTLKRSYLLDVDYIVYKNKDKTIKKKDPRNNNYKQYLLTPDCFKRLAMMSRSKNGDMIRTYFIEIEGLFIKYREQTIYGIQKELETLIINQKPVGNFDKKSGYIYIIRASDLKDGLYKIGRNSKDLVTRLKGYNVGRADNIEVLYTYKAPDIIGAEGCLKAYLKKYQYRKYKEVYETSIDIIKEFTKSCANIGAKMIQKQNKSIMKGGYYMVLVPTND